MTDKTKKKKRGFHSLKLRLLIAIIFSLALATLVFFSVRSGIIGWVENSYNAPDAKQDRLDGYLADLQDYVRENKLSSADTAEITRWLRGTRNVYLFLYRDNQLFFTGGIDDDEPEQTDKDTDDDSGEDNGTDSDTGTDNGAEGDADTNDPDGESGGENSGSDTENAPADGEDADGEADANPDVGNGDEPSDGTEAAPDEGGNQNGTAEGEGGEASGEKPARPGTSRPGTGITVTLPTKEEILQHAADNGLKPIELSDGTLLASFVDFSDYFYYNLSNVVSIAAALLLMIILLMIYFRGITLKISRLAEDVSSVYTEDMNKSIRTSDGKDEISELARNVEEMRRSILAGLQKEREALDANSELITSMSHDIRTPLTVLLGYLDLMKTYPVNDEMAEYIRASENTALRLKELSDDMFRYFLVFGGKELDVTMSDYDARTLFEQLLSEHVLLLRERGFSTDWKIDIPQDNPITVCTDAPKLMRVVDNVFSNIHKYADPDVPIVFSAFETGGVLNIEIVNKIIGEAKAESNGVGLRTCSKICEALGISFAYGARDDAERGRIFVSTVGFKIKNGGEKL